MNYNDINMILIKEFPDLSIDDDDLELQYITAGIFTQYLLKAYKNKDIETIQKGFDFIDRLHVSEDKKLQELATVGYLESILFSWPQNIVTSDEFYKHLSTESKKWWSELNRFWNGEIRYIGETFEANK